jgi:hypothetical protein
MPLNDYTDPELGLVFPRLQARIQPKEGNTSWVQIWLRPELGERREVIMNQKIGGSWRDAFEYLFRYAKEKNLLIEPDDIEVFRVDG